MLWLLENKAVFSALLGVIAFSQAAPRACRAAASLVFAALAAEYVLFGDKFFTVLNAGAFFVMPYLLRTPSLARGLKRLVIPGAAMLAGVFALTLYIYSDYGSRPLSTGVMKLQERMAGQGQLWFIATQDNPRILAFNRADISRYLSPLRQEDPAAAAFAEGADTYYFIFRYAPHQLKRAFRANQGWVQFTMGFEAVGLVLFGYAGLAVLLGLAAAITAIVSLFMLRALTSEFPLSIIMASWAVMQVHVALNQAALWTVFATGQWRRLFLCGAVESCIAVFNRGDRLARSRDSAADLRHEAQRHRRDWILRHGD